MSAVGTVFHQGETENDLVIERVQDCTPVLDYATNLRSHGAIGSSEMRHAATFPMVLVEKYCNLNGVSFHEFMSNPVHVKRMLADPDLKGFRVWEGRA